MESVNNFLNALVGKDSKPVSHKGFKRVVPSCCGCIGNNVDPKSLPLKAIGLDFLIEDGISRVRMHLKYTNEGSSPLEVQFQFPSDPEFAVTRMTVKIGSKEIETKIMEKEKAEEKYDDSVASGNTGVRAKYDEDVPDVINLSIGQLQPSKEADITIELVSLLGANEKSLYSLLFPLVFLPQARDTVLACEVTGQIRSGK